MLYDALRSQLKTRTLLLDVSFTTKPLCYQYVMYYTIYRYTKRLKEPTYELIEGKWDCNVLEVETDVDHVYILF